MAHDDLVATSSLLRTTGPSTWPTRRGKLVGRRYGGASGRAADLARVRPNPQRSYGRPDKGKANTLTCGRIPHRKDRGRGGGVRRHEPILVSSVLLLYLLTTRWSSLGGVFFEDAKAKQVRFVSIFPRYHHTNPFHLLLSPCPTVLAKPLSTYSPT
ncbi:hypothetical protein BHM03_00045495 [Ensete ventricosum]|nr:hypothetical protein BHM03_00045495 [Ensete ventricosum]